jgi:hypothetical protein
MRKIFLAIVLTSLSVSTGAFAQQAAPAGRGGTADEQAACTRDVEKFCRPVMDQGDFTVLACLKENRAKISKACDQVLKNHNQ